MRYEPSLAPEISEWGEADEGTRLDAVSRFHERSAEPVANLRLHAAIHVAVETEIATGRPAVLRAMARLLDQGLDRHDALHAIGSVVAEQLFGALRDKAFDAAQYEARLDALTAAAWRTSPA